MHVMSRACIHTGTIKRKETTKLISIPCPKISDGQILIRSIACAANPADWKHIASGWGTGGDIAGSDVSGIVAEVGCNVKGFKVGDIVSSFMHGNFCETRGAFSEYVVADVNTTIKYDKANFNTQALGEGDNPSNLINTYEGAASVTLGLSTVGVSFHFHLGIKCDKQANAFKYILIWGGATSTGTLAIQIAKLVYNLKVITTASSVHHDFLRSLGADYVFDYHDSDVVEQIKKVGGARIHYALDTVSELQTFQSVYDATAETKEVVIDNLLFLEFGANQMDPSRKVTSTATLVFLVEGIEMDLNGLIISPNLKLIKAYNDFWFNVLPPYISKIRHANLKVLKPGLESANEALDLLRENKIKGQKLVFRSSA